jgi:Carbamoyltransferase C-terminus
MSAVRTGLREKSNRSPPCQNGNWKKASCPVLVNTSFNVRGEPIVCTEDAFSCFMGTEIEFLAVGNCILRKDHQNPDLAKDYKNAFDPVAGVPPTSASHEMQRQPLCLITARRYQREEEKPHRT